MHQITFPMFHDSASQRLMWGPSCFPTKHFFRAPGMTMGMQSFPYQSWEPEDRLVFPGMQPIRKEMEGTQDVLSTVSHSTWRWREDGALGWLAWAGGRVIHRDFLHITTSPVKDSGYVIGIPYSGFPLHLPYHCFFSSCRHLSPDLSNTSGYV